MLQFLKRAALAAAWIFGGGALIVVVFVASFCAAMRVEMRSTEVAVPDFRGLTAEEAGRRAAPAGLVLHVAGERHDPGMASGRVLEQMPQPGAAVRRGRKVKLVLSLGGKVLTVPDLVGHPAREVAIELSQEGFVAGEEARVPSYDLPAGRVLAQVPPARTTAVPTSRVHRLVSDGPPEPVWVMPDLTGRSRAEIESWLAAAGFRVGTVRRVGAAGRRRDSIVGQLPLAGYPIRPREIVELSIAD